MRIAGLAVSVSLILLAGCTSDTGLEPGVSYGITIITRGPQGQSTPQETALRVESAVTESVKEFDHQGQKFSVQVRKTQSGKATFDVSFPNGAVQRIQVKAGEAKDVLPKGQNIGVRIDVQEAH
jgi:hypothetical protein